MRRTTYHWLALGLLVLGCIIPTHVAAQGEKPATLVIEGGTLIDGNGGAPVRDALIIIRGNRIETVSRKGQAPYPSDARVLRADGKYILPGLMDAHVHYSAFMAELLLAHGVTTVFDIGTGALGGLLRRKAVARGKIAGPRLFVAVEGVSAPVRSEGVVTPVTVERAREVVKRVVAAGGDMARVGRGLTPEVVAAVAEEAHKAGLPVVGQTIGLTVYAREAVLAGVDILEHASGVSYSIAKDPSKWKGWGEAELHSLDPRPFADMDEGKAAELIQLMVKRNVYLEPDLIAQGRGLHRQRDQWEVEDYRLLSKLDLAYIPAGVRHKWLANYTEFEERSPAAREQLKKGYENMRRFIGQFARAGGKVMAGDDTSSTVGWAVSGIGLHREMEVLVEAGLTPMQALMAATRNPAEGYRVLDRVGTIEAGKLADLVIVNADPLQDIRNTQKIEWAIQDGKVLERTYHRWFEDPWPYGQRAVNGLDWVAALKQVTTAGMMHGGKEDPTWAFGQPCPAIESISPTMVTEGDPVVTLTIQGFNFTSKSVVSLDGIPIPAQLVNATELRATIDASLIARAKTIPIRVENPGPYLWQPDWGATSNTAHLVVNFRY